MNGLQIFWLISLSLILILQGLYWFYFYFKLIAYKNETSIPEPEDLPISIVICARNEAENLKLFLPKILKQNYPFFEVILVNDRSIDDTRQYIQKLQNEYSKLKYLEITEHERSWRGKKQALSAGIAAAQHEHLVLTDADCYPASEDWLKSMASAFTPHQQIVLGYGAYVAQDTWLNRCIRFDTMQIGATYLSYALRGLAYMGVGRNLAYTRNLFKTQKGFSAHAHIASGDDDLFVSAAAQANNVTIQILPKSHTISVPKNTWSDWVRQKTRHLSTAYMYQERIKFLLVMSFVLQYLFFIVCVIGIFSVKLWFIALSAVLLRGSVFTYINFKLSKVLNEAKIWYYSIIFEILFLGIYPILHLRKRFEIWRHGRVE